MARKSTITRLPAEQRKFIEKLLREDRLTLDEMIAAIRTRYPDASVHRSTLHRYKTSVEELTQRMHEIDRAAEALVGELGEGIGEKSGALLAHAVTTLATNAALRAQTDDTIDIDDVRKLARAAKDALDTRVRSLKERQALRQEARDELLREQAKALDSVVKSGGLSAQTADMLRRQLLGVQ